VVAAVQDGRHPIVAFDEGGEFREHVPGIAALAGGELVVGWRAAEALADGTAEHAIQSIKRVAQSLMPDAPRPDLRETVIAERYTYASDGTITVRIENMSRGYSRTYQLGAL
jgi:hypothetical protein